MDRAPAFLIVVLGLCRSERMCAHAVAAVAVVGKDNDPLFLQHFNDADELKFHYIVHTSLDIVEEKAASGNGSSSSDLFLGLLCPIEDFHVYGYVTNTQIKLIAVLEDIGKVQVRDAEIKTVSCRTFLLVVLS